MIVVSDSRPLIHLARINKIELKENFFDEVYMPQAGCYAGLVITG